MDLVNLGCENLCRTHYFAMLSRRSDSVREHAKTGVRDYFCTPLISTHEASFPSFSKLELRLVIYEPRFKDISESISTLTSHSFSISLALSFPPGHCDFLPAHFTTYGTLHYFTIYLRSSDPPPSYRCWRNLPPSLLHNVSRLTFEWELWYITRGSPVSSLRSISHSSLECVLSPSASDLLESLAGQMQWGPRKHFHIDCSFSFDFVTEIVSNCTFCWFSWSFVLIFFPSTFE